jgi:hypothetical protein
MDLHPEWIYGRFSVKNNPPDASGFRNDMDLIAGLSQSGHYTEFCPFEIELLDTDVMKGY